MPPITTEREWLACESPRDLGRFASGRVDPLRFRWLAVDWAAPLRRYFQDYDLPWLDALIDWADDRGPHPSVICQQPQYVTMVNHPSPAVEVIFCGDYLRRNDLILATAFAGEARSEDVPRFTIAEATQLPDYAHTHRSRSSRARATRGEGRSAAAAAQRAAWRVLAAERDARVLALRHDVCDQFRDVVGNPFRPVSIRPEWRSADVVAIADAVHADRRLDLLPYLGEALLEAGCEDEVILTHCYGPGPHVRGCWVVESFRTEAAPSLS